MIKYQMTTISLKNLFFYSVFINTKQIIQHCCHANIIGVKVSLHSKPRYNCMYFKITRPVQLLLVKKQGKKKGIT